MAEKIDYYILVHLDDGSLGNYVVGDEAAEQMSSNELLALERAVAAEIWRAADGAARRLIVSDSPDYAAHGDPPTLAGRSFDPGDCRYLEAHEVTRIAREVPVGSRVAVGGHHRTDCVARVIAALRRRGIQTARHESGTIPLDYPAFRALTSEMR